MSGVKLQDGSIFQLPVIKAFFTEKLGESNIFNNGFDKELLKKLLPKWVDLRNLLTEYHRITDTLNEGDVVPNSPELQDLTRGIHRYTFAEASARSMLALWNINCPDEDKEHKGNEDLALPLWEEGGDSNLGEALKSAWERFPYLDEKVSKRWDDCSGYVVVPEDPDIARRDGFYDDFLMNTCFTPAGECYHKDIVPYQKRQLELLAAVIVEAEKALV